MSNITIEISAPVWDTINNCLIYPVKPEHRDICSNINNILSDNPLDDFVGRYQCCVCKDKVHPNRPSGNIRWYFSHYPNSNCSMKDNTSNSDNESSNHKLAKYLLREVLMSKRIISIAPAKCSTTECKSIGSSCNVDYIDGDVSHVEYTLDNGSRADVVLINNESIRYVFEIRETSKTKTYRPNPWFEFTARNVLDQYATFKNTTDIIMLRDIKDYYCGNCPQSHSIKLIIDTPHCNRNINQSVGNNSDYDHKFPYATIGNLKYFVKYHVISDITHNIPLNDILDTYKYYCTKNNMKINYINRETFVGDLLIISPHLMIQSEVVLRHKICHFDKMGYDMSKSSRLNPVELTLAANYQHAETKRIKYQQALLDMGRSINNIQLYDNSWMIGWNHGTK